jgi:ribosome-associated heat shock protein Hsp15
VDGEQSGGRVDSWIWAVRLTKTRSIASSACRGGHVKVNGARVKPAHVVRPGDEVRLRQEERERIVVVTQIVTKRVAAAVAAACYTDHSPPPPPKTETVTVAVRDRGAGRPTKRDRRSIERLLGRPRG